MKKSLVEKSHESGRPFASTLSDIWTKAKRSEVMSKIRGTNTQPEVRLRKHLHGTGHRYRLHPRDLPGRPDIAFPKERLAVFVDGCFWHGCPVHYQPPASNASFWRAKLDENRERDRRRRARLAARGWAVLRFWEHEVYSDLARCSTRVDSELQRLRRAPVQPLDRGPRQARGGPHSRSGRS
jgi:DNA mismatch endonuclease (patch repair protein)